MKRKNKIFIAALLVVILCIALAFSACGGVELKVRLYLSPNETKVYNTLLVDENGKVTLPTDPSREGHIFNGWYTDTALSQSFNVDSIINNNIDLYAGWRQLPDKPTGLTYDEASKQIKWEAVEGIAGYELKIIRNGAENTVSLESGVTAYDVDEPGVYKIYIQSIKTANEIEDKSGWSEPYNFVIVAPEFFVTFKDGLYTIATVKIIDGKVILPDTPIDASGDRIFAGWFVDQACTEAFDENDVEETGNISVYAKWLIRPVAPTVTYVPAKAGGIQKLYWTDSTQDVDKYILEIYNDDDKLVQSAELEASSREFILDATKYTVGTVYTSKLKIVSKTLWQGNAIESDFSETPFTYSVVAENTIQVTFIADDKEYRIISVDKDGNVVLPEQVPTKPGFAFEKWVTEKGGDVDFVPSGITKNITVYAKWIERPDAPSFATFDDETLTLTLENIVGIEGDYLYKIDNGAEKTSDTNRVTVFGLTKGQHTVSVKITKAGIESEWNEINFEVNSIYILLEFNNDNDVLFLQIGTEGKVIEVPDAPEAEGKQFIKWTFDDAIESSGINLASATFDRGVKLYAQWLDRPNMVTSVRFVETDSGGYIEWDAVLGENITYELKWNNSTQKIIIPEGCSYVLSLPQEGEFTVEIRTVDVINGITVYSEWSKLSVTISFEAKTGRTDSGIMFLTVNDKRTYIFYAGQSYDFGDPNATFDKNDLRYTILANGVIKMTDATGGLVLHCTQNGVEKDVNILVVPQIEDISAGLGYAQYIHESTSGENSVFLDTTGKYTVGTAQNSRYYIDLELAYKSGMYGDIENEFNWLFSLKDKGDTDWDKLDVKPTDLGIIIQRNTDGIEGYIGKYYINFSEPYNGKILQIKLSPKYPNALQDANIEDYTVIFEVELNDGINVYTHDQLKTNYANTNIYTINIHRDILSRLDADQINPNESAVNLKDLAADTTPDGSKKAGDVYRRKSSTSNTCVINGNYFIIDATNVPKIRYASDFGEIQWKPNGFGDYKVQGVHTSIFRIIGGADIDVRTVFNNLEIIGNTDLKGSTVGEVELYSGGHNGIETYQSSVDCFNTYVHHTTIAYFLDSYQNTNNYSNLTKVKADQNWGNSIYMWGSGGLILSQSQLLSSSGAALHIEDGISQRNANPLYETALENRHNEVRRDPVLIIDNTNIIRNWVSGEEAWFTAWGMGSIVPEVKIELQKTTFGYFGKSVIKEVDGAEKFNFAVMLRGTINESQVEVVIKEGENTVKEYVHVSSTAGSGETVTSVPSVTLDPRYMDNTQMLMPLGENVDFNPWVQQLFAYPTWLGIYNDAITEGKTQEQAIAHANENCIYDNLVLLHEGEQLTDADKQKVLEVLTEYAPNEAAIGIELYKYSARNGGYDIGGSNYYSIVMNGTKLHYDGGSISTIWFEYGSGEGWLNKELPTD